MKRERNKAKHESKVRPRLKIWQETGIGCSHLQHAKPEVQGTLLLKE